MGVWISYSKVSTFKACPQKYYLSKEWPAELNVSALPFGTAVENGVDVLVQGGVIEEAVKVFEKDWFKSPANKWSSAKQIFDDPEMPYYGSDYDKNLLIAEKEQAKILEWQKELFPEEDIPWEDLVKEFQDKLSDAKTIKKELRQFCHRIFWLSCKKRGKLLVEAFQRDLLPQITKVIAVQKKISIKNDEGDQLTGYVDYELELKDYTGPIITDVKTSGMFYDKHALNSSDQLAIYGAAEGIDKIGYMILIKSIKHEKSCDACKSVRINGRLKKCAEEGCKGRYTDIRSYAMTQLLVRDMREGEAEEVVEDFSDVLVAIKNGVNWKNPSSCFNYNKKCEYYDYCWGGKKLEDLPGIKKKEKKNVR